MPQTDETGFFAWVTRLVREHRSALAAIARKEGLLAEEAFDAVQEAFTTFLGLPHSRRLANEVEDSRNLLAVLVRNHARNRRRRHDWARPHLTEPEVVESLVDVQESVESLISQAEAHVLAFQCVELLGEVQRKVVTLRPTRGAARREGGRAARHDTWERRGDPPPREARAARMHGRLSRQRTASTGAECRGRTAPNT